MRASGSITCRSTPRPPREENTPPCDGSRSLRLYRSGGNFLCHPQHLHRPDDLGALQPRPVLAASPLRHISRAPLVRLHNFGRDPAPSTSASGLPPARLSSIGHPSSSLVAPAAPRKHYWSG